MMTAEQYKEWLLGAQGKLLGHVTAAPAIQDSPPADHTGLTQRAMRVAGLPDPQHGGQHIWGAE